MKRTLLAAALLLTSVFGITGCGSDDDVPPAERRIKNSTGDDILDLGISNPGLSKMEQIKEQQEMEIDDLVKQTENNLLSSLSEVNDDINNDSKDDDFLDSNDLLPEDSDSTWIQNSPSGSGGLDLQNLLNAGHHVGINTTGCNMRNSNRGLRSEPPNPQVQVSPWLQSTICPDPFRRPLE